MGERAHALARGKATASVIGTKAMGTRFNVLMTIQVPLQQKRKPDMRGAGGFGFGGGAGFLSLAAMECDGMSDDECNGMMGGMMMESASLCAAPPSMAKGCRRAGSPEGMQRGTANAARVSRGSEFDVWPGLSVKDPERNSSEHVTVTVVIYNTVADGVPSEADVIAAIDDLEDLYAKCGAQGHLADNNFDFMKKELTVKDAIDINTKVTAQPYKPPAAVVDNFDVFLTSQL